MTAQTGMYLDAETDVTTQSPMTMNKVHLSSTHNQQEVPAREELKQGSGRREQRLG